MDRFYVKPKHRAVFRDGMVSDEDLDISSLDESSLLVCFESSCKRFKSFVSMASSFILKKFLIINISSKNIN